MYANVGKVGVVIPRLGQSSEITLGGAGTYFSSIDRKVLLLCMTARFNRYMVVFCAPNSAECASVSTDAY